MLSIWNRVVNNTVWPLPLQRFQYHGGNPQKKKKRKPAEEYRITNYIIYNKYYKVNKQGADIERET